MVTEDIKSFIIHTNINEIEESITAFKDNILYAQNIEEVENIQSNIKILEKHLISFQKLLFLDNWNIDACVFDIKLNEKNEDGEIYSYLDYVISFKNNVTITDKVGFNFDFESKSLYFYEVLESFIISFDHMYQDIYEEYACFDEILPLFIKEEIVMILKEQCLLSIEELGINDIILV